jgi:hypothetical protein
VGQLPNCCGGQGESADAAGNSGALELGAITLDGRAPGVSLVSLPTTDQPAGTHVQLHLVADEAAAAMPTLE